MKYKELKGYKYLVVEDETFFCTLIEDEIETDYVSLHNGLFTVKAGYAWDGPSGISFDTKTFRRGSLLHDALYQLMREGLLNRKLYREYADEKLRDICLEDGMWKFRAWYVFKVVRVCGKKSSMPRKEPRGKIIEI